MAGSRQTNTFGEMLQKMLRDLADMKTAPDVDLPFVIDLETQIVGKLRQGIDNVAQQGLTQVPPDPAMGMAMGMGMQAPPPPVAPGVPGVRSMPTMPSPDELRRILTAGPTS